MLFNCHQVDEMSSLDEFSPYTNRFPGAVPARVASAPNDVFVPLVCKDTMFNKRQGTNQQVNAKLLCITARPPYSTASLEELRWKIYQTSVAPSLSSNFSYKSLVVARPVPAPANVISPLQATPSPIPKPMPTYYPTSQLSQYPPIPRPIPESLLKAEPRPITKPICSDAVVGNPKPGDSHLSCIYATTTAAPNIGNPPPYQVPAKNNVYRVADSRFPVPGPTFVPPPMTYNPYLEADLHLPLNLQTNPSCGRPLPSSNCVNCENIEQCLNKMIPALVEKLLAEKMATDVGRQINTPLGDEASKLSLEMKKSDIEYKTLLWNSHLVIEQVHQARLNTRLLQLKVDNAVAKASKKKSTKKSNAGVKTSGEQKAAEIVVASENLCQLGNQTGQAVVKGGASMIDQHLQSLTLAMQEQCVVQGHGIDHTTTTGNIGLDAAETNLISKPPEKVKKQQEEYDNDSDGHSSWSDVQEEEVIQAQHSSPVF